MENPKKTDRIELTPEIRDKLIYEYKRTGLGGSAIMRGQRGEYPDGLRSDMIDAWRNGAIKTARTIHFEWILNRYENYEPPEKPVDQHREKITITDDRLADIRSEVKRTKLGAVNIIRLSPKPLPDGLNHQKVQRWISGQTKTALKANWGYVLRLYESISDKNSGD